MSHADYDYVALNRGFVTRDGYNSAVLVTSGKVQRFAESWPCSGLRDCELGVIFEYAANGDLVDIEWFDAETGKTVPEPENADGAAVLALSQDAQEWLKTNGETN